MPARHLPYLVAAVILLACPAAVHAAGPTTWYDYFEIYDRDTPRLENAKFDSELFAAKRGNRWGLIDQRGVWIAAPEFEWTDDGVDGLARAILNGKTGFIDGIGNWRIEPTFDWVDRFVDGHAVFRDRGRYGLIDPRGRTVLEPKYEGILRFRENYAAVQVGNRVGFIDRRLRFRIEPRFAVARSFHQSLAAVRFADDERQHAGRWGYVNLRGQIVWADPTGNITELGDFNQNLAAYAVRLPDGSLKWGYLHQDFSVAIPPRFDQASDFTDGLAAVAVLDGEPSSGWGYINRSGRWELAPQFDWADDFDARLAMIRFQGRFGFVDRAGRTGLFPQWADAEPFERGYALVSDGNHMAYVGPTGGVLFDPAEITQAERRVDSSDGFGFATGRVSLVGDPILDKRSGTVSKLSRYPRFSAVPYRLLYLDGGDGPFPVPYEAEYLYDERLPRPQAGGLIPPNEQDAEANPNEDLQWIDAENPGVIPDDLP